MSREATLRKMWKVEKAEIVYTGRCGGVLRTKEICGIFNGMIFYERSCNVCEWFTQVKGKNGSSVFCEKLNFMYFRNGDGQMHKGNGQGKMQLRKYIGSLLGSGGECVHCREGACYSEVQ